MSRSPAVILYDANGVAMAVENGVAIPAGTRGLLIAGSDGTNARVAKVTSAGRVVTDGSEVTQPVSAASLPLPSGAATETTLSAINTKTPALGQTTMAGSQPVAIASNQTAIPITDNGGSLTVDATSWPLPTGAATETTLLAIKNTDGIKKIVDPVSITMGAGSYGGQVEGRAADSAAPVGNPVYVAGWDGTTLRAVKTDTQGRLVTAPAGASSASAGFAFGDIALSAVVSNTAVRRTIYTEQTTNAQRSLVSANANDTSAGTGARTVRITYYTATFTGPFTEVVTLNGTTPVNTVATDICYIEKLEVVTAGSGGTNAGIISLKAATAGGGATVWSIGAGDLQTYGALHYVATGKTCYITSLSVVINGGQGVFFLRSKPLSVSNSVEAQVSDYVRMATQAGSITRTYGTAIPISGPARLTAYVNTEANTALTYRAAFDFYDQ